MKIIIKENKHIEAGVYDLEELAEMMSVIVDAIRMGERVGVPGVAGTLTDETI